MAWWQSAVVYQIYPRSFADSDGDGIGDLPGIAGRLDHLAELGVDVIWLSPIYPSPQDDAGYDISDYQDIDPTFGTLADFDALLAAVHERGMKLVMDLVVNHTSDEHPWFVESRSSRSNAKRDWYWWRPQPTNWRSFFSGPTWELDEATGEYYLHLFSRKQPDLNWENPEVRQAIYSMMRWWIDRGVDGFRMDVINMLSKDPALPDAPGGDGSPYYLCGPRIHEFLQEMHREVFAGREELLTVGEMPGVTLENAKLFTDPERGEVDMVFQFEHVELDHVGSKWDLQPLRLTDLKRSFGRWQAGLAERGWNSLYWNNHDQPRVVSRYGDGSPEAAKMLGTILHMHRGTPYVYQGEELGMTNFPFSLARPVPRHRVAQPLRRNGFAASAAGREPRPRAHADAVGRLAARRLHDRHAVARSQPEPRRDQRRGAAGGSRLGLPPLPPADRAAPQRAGRGPRRLHDAARGRRARLRVHAAVRGHRAARARELLRRRGARGSRGLGGRRAAHRRAR